MSVKAVVVGVSVAARTEHRSAGFFGGNRNRLISCFAFIRQLAETDELIAPVVMWEPYPFCFCSLKKANAC